MATKPEPFVTLGWSAISWIEHYLVHGPGDVQGQPIELDDEFAQFILKAYRLDPKTGARRVRRSFLSRAKGRNKSGLAGFVACFEALGPARFDHWAEPGEVSAWGYEYEPGEPVGKPLIYVEVLCVATEEGQAGNTYDGIVYMLHPETCSDALRDDYPGLDVGLSRVLLPNARGSIEPMSSGDSSKDGGKSTFIVADETHLWIRPASPKAKDRLRSLHATMARNLLKRKIASGWMLETSTMYGTGEDSVAEGTHLYAMTAKPGTRAAESLLFDHRQAADSWDLRDRRQRIKALREAYGPAAEWMDIDALADAWDDPQVTEAQYRRYWLNQPVPMTPERITIMPKWADCGISDRRLDGSPKLALATSFDRAWSSLGAATVAEDGKLLVKPLVHGAGTEWVVDACVEHQAMFDTPILLAAKGPAAMFTDALDAVGVKYVELDTNAECDAAALIYDAVETGKLRHFKHVELDRAVEDVTWQTSGDRRKFARRSGDITPLEGISLAALSASKQVVPPPSPRRARQVAPASTSVSLAGF